MADESSTHLIFVGGADELRLEDGGRAYRPGEALPPISDEQRVALRSAGIALMTAPTSPESKPRRAAKE